MQVTFVIFPFLLDALAVNLMSMKHRPPLISIVDAWVLFFFNCFSLCLVVHYYIIFHFQFKAVCIHFHLFELFLNRMYGER